MNRDYFKLLWATPFLLAHSLLGQWGMLACWLAGLSYIAQYIYQDDKKNGSQDG